MSKAKCNKDLFAIGGTIKCFTKGKNYEVLYHSDEKMTLIDNQDCPHSVWMCTKFILDGWMDHFTLIEKKNGNRTT